MPDNINKSTDASDVIWNWRSSGLYSRSQSPSSLRKKGAMQGAGAAIIASLFWYFDLRTMSYIAGTMATIVLVAAIVSPNRAFATLNRGADKLGRFLGNCIKWIFLPAVYYLFFLPFGILFRRGDNDSLQRTYAPGNSTYWINRKESGVVSRSRSKQF